MIGTSRGGRSKEIVVIEMDDSNSQMKSCHRDQRGYRCQHMIVVAFVLGALSAIAGMLASQPAQRSIAQMKPTPDPARPTGIQS